MQPLQPLHRFAKSLILLKTDENDSYLHFDMR